MNLGAATQNCYLNQFSWHLVTNSRVLSKWFPTATQPFSMFFSSTLSVYKNYIIQNRYCQEHMDHLENEMFCASENRSIGSTTTLGWRQKGVAERQHLFCFGDGEHRQSIHSEHKDFCILSGSFRFFAEDPTKYAYSRRWQTRDIFTGSPLYLQAANKIQEMIP